MHPKIISFLSFISLAIVYGDLLGQNRLGNNRWLFRLRFNKNTVSQPNSLLLPVMMELAKTADGRKSLKTYLKNVGQKKTRKFSHRYVRRF